MSTNVNIYCDESNHLENDHRRYMVLGGIYCPLSDLTEVNTRLREIKKKHNLAENIEIKWTKVSPSRLNFFLDVVDYFFDESDIRFRAVVIDKEQLSHDEHTQTHDDFYYKMYFLLLSRILEPTNRYNIYLDIKDTLSATKVDKLHDVLSKNMLDFERSIIQRIQNVRSHEINALQLADLLIGAIQFANREDVQSEAKREIVERIRERSGYSLLKSTLPTEKKLNIFHWRGKQDLEHES